ncbi:MAG TPA: VWA domain-containing protein, partial [Gammaproteobacteria bacterium]|nr:VWA domain-containing protein [Gammaproteobacteria bacterium]
MFEFLWPFMALLLPVPLLVRLFWPRFIRPGQEVPTEGHRTTLLHPALNRLETSFKTHRPRTAIASKLQALLLTLLWIALTLTAMRPQLLEPYTEIKSAGYDLMLSIDTSRSMTALD